MVTKRVMEILEEDPTPLSGLSIKGQEIHTAIGIIIQAYQDLYTTTKDLYIISYLFLFYIHSIVIFIMF